MKNSIQFETNITNNIINIPKTFKDNFNGKNVQVIINSKHQDSCVDNKNLSLMSCNKYLHLNSHIKKETKGLFLEPIKVDSIELYSREELHER